MLRASAADLERPRLVQGDGSPFAGPAGITIVLTDPPPPEQAWLARAHERPLDPGERAACPDDRPAPLRDGAPFAVLGAAAPTHIVGCELAADDAGRYAVLRLADQASSLALARPGTSFPGALSSASTAPRSPEFLASLQQSLERAGLRGLAPLSASTVTFQPARLPAPATGVTHAMLDLPSCRPDCLTEVVALTSDQGDIISLVHVQDPDGALPALETLLPEEPSAHVTTVATASRGDATDDLVFLATGPHRAVWYHLRFEPTARLDVLTTSASDE